MIRQNPLLEAASSPEEQLVRRYFREVIDGRSDKSLDTLFAPDCRIVRADRGNPLVGLEALRRFVRLSLHSVPKISTVIEDMIDDGSGRIVALVAHSATFGSVVATPLGLTFSLGKKASWRAIAIFRVRDGLIAEEQVIRDELAILRDLGMLKKNGGFLGAIRHWMRLGQKGHSMSRG